MTVASFPARLAGRALGLGLLATIVGCGGGTTPSRPQADNPAEILDPVEEAKLAEPRIKNFCAGCHPLPRPESFPQFAWEEEVEQGYDLFFTYGRTDLKPVTPKRLVVDYFREQAPELLEIETPTYAASPVPVQFEKQGFDLIPGNEKIFVANIQSMPKTDFHEAGLFVCDMMGGHVLIADPSKPDEPATVLEMFRNPVHVAKTDLDSDNVPDYVVSDLGSFLPEDHDLGRVYWLKRSEDGESWEKKNLLARVGRVTSVVEGDFDGDSLPDLIVAEFGWRLTGRIHLLRNQTTDPKKVKFKTEMVDNRNGAIHVEKCDLNNDGLLDFVSVIAQEHEAVVAFLNKGDGAFRPEEIWSAGYPSYGSSGMTLVDLDQDDDLDVLYTNGDSFDDAMVKPYHSVQWLENKGDYPFERHELAKMPGVHRALAGDMDGDGDLDVVAVAMLPNAVRNQRITSEFDSVILLEQVEDKKFERHRLEAGNANHAAFEIGDFDNDNDLDLAIGVFWLQPGAPPMTVWWNQSNP